MEAADKETSGSNLEKETTSFNQGDNEGVNQELGNTVTTETMSSSHLHQEDDTGKNQETAGSSSSEQVPQESVKEGNPGLSITETGSSSHQHHDDEYDRRLKEMKRVIESKKGELMSCVKEMERLNEGYTGMLRSAQQDMSNLSAEEVKRNLGSVEIIVDALSKWQDEIANTVRQIPSLERDIMILENQYDRITRLGDTELLYNLAADAQRIRKAAGID